jgi:hypothetical protein
MAKRQPADDPKLALEIYNLASSLKGQAVAELVWELLTEQEQKQLSASFFKKHVANSWSKIRDVSVEQAIVDLAHEIDLLTVARHRQLRNRLGKPLSAGVGEDPAVPIWDKEARELRFQGEVIRKVPRPTQAHRIVAILDAFQTNDWSARVDGPSRKSSTGTDLHAAIRSLNQTLTKIRFHSDGTGMGVSWKLKSS